MKIAMVVFPIIKRFPIPNTGCCTRDTKVDNDKTFGGVLMESNRKKKNISKG